MGKVRRYLFFILPIVILIPIACYSSRPSASDYQRTVSHAIDPAETTPLKQAVETGTETHPGESGFHLISRGTDALLIRLAMIQAAQRSLDIQYYSFQDDDSGKLLLEAILRAADRGVRVRLLIDDISLKKSDATWSLLDSHPHIEIRIFNPFATRDQGILSRIGDVFTDLGHFTKRMHNKGLITDNQASLIGGRNLGDAYFDNSQDFNFRDTDILAIGPITSKVSRSFDSFWNGDEAFPLHALVVPKKDADAMAHLRETLKNHWQEAVEKGALANTPSLASQLHDGQLPLVWAHAELAADSPDKIDEPKKEVESKPENRLENLVDHAKYEFIAVSPYFVPGDEGVQWLKEIINRGVKIRLLTNSLASTDVIAVHTGYRRYRKAVIADGVDLYELKPIPGTYPRTGRFASSSRASLHTKIFVIDRSDIIIGTMNLDPRSIQLNTEIALVIHSPELAQQLVQMFDHAILPSSSYHVVLTDDDNPNSHLEWITEENGREVHYENEPKAGFWRNVKAGLYAILPFEDQL